MAEPITITLRNTARSYLEIIFHRKWLLLIPVIFFTLFAWGYSYTVTPMYRSTAIIEIQEKAKDNPYIQRFSKSTPITQRLGAVLQRVKSRSLVEDIIKELRLQETVKTDTEYRQLISFVRSNMEVKISGKSLLEISCNYTHPETAQKIVNLVTRNIIKENLELQDQETQVGIEWIEKELELYRQKMEESEEKLRAFQERYADLMPDELASELYTSLTYTPTYGGGQVTPPFPREFLRQSQYGSRYQNFSEILLNQGVRFRELQKRKDAILRQLEREEEFIVSQKVTETNPVVQSLRREMTEKQVRLARLMVDATAEHPTVKRLTEEIENLRVTLETGGGMTLKEETTSINPIYQAARMELEEVERELESLEESIEINKTIAQAAFEKIKQIPEKQKELAELRRNNINFQATYNTLLAQREMARVTRRLELEERGTQFLIIDNAEAPLRPFKPKKSLIVFAGFFLGVVIGGALIVLAETTDHSFEEPNQLREFLPIPMLGATSQIMTPEEKSFINAKKRLAILTLLVVVTFIILTVIVFMIFGQG
jgi:polysaccharide biosynthesis transport protein